MRQGLTHDYTHRFGVEHEHLVLPEGADAVYWTREQLWNAAEFAEVRKDGRTAREWQLAIPEEFQTKEERQKLALTFARELAGRYGCAVDVGIHLPDRKGDQRNHHAHLLATTRVVAGEGLGDKTLIELSDAKRLSMGLGQGRQEIEQIRALWAERANQALEKKGREERIDSRSLVAQQQEALTAGDIIRAAVLDRMPEIKMGWKATAMERRRSEPIQTERGDQLRAIRQENSLRKTFTEQIAKLKDKLQQIAQFVAQRRASERAKELAKEIAQKAEAQRRQGAMDRAREFAAQGPPRLARERWQRVEAWAQTPPPFRAHDNAQALLDAWLAYAGRQGFDTGLARSIVTSDREEIRSTCQARIDSFHEQVAELEKKGHRWFRSNEYQSTIDGYQSMVRNEGERGNKMLELSDRFQEWKPLHEAQALEEAKQRHADNQALFRDLEPHIETALLERERSYRPQQNLTRERPKERDQDRGRGE